MNDYEQIEILLVEDNPYDAELALRAFRRHKLTNNILWLKDGAEALDFFFDGDTPRNRRSPKLILLDLKLPKVDGLEVLARLKSSSATSMIPIAIMTSSQEECDQIKSYKLGANSYIIKPADFNQLIETVKLTGSYWLITNKLPY